uniref:Uncharacterized protein n=1 Tax=Panagrolaimus superbus TaxID=310955 RepID=A0A914Z9X2_9BILA
MLEKGNSTAEISNSGRGLTNIIDGIPILGHIKGIYHYSKDDLKSGKQTLSAATRSLVVVVGGIGGREVGGWIGAAGAGLLSGTGYDFFVSVLNEKPYGFFAVLKDATNNPSPKTIFATVIIPIADAFAGALTATISPSSLQPIDAAKYFSLGIFGSCSPPVFAERSISSDPEIQIPKIVLPSVSTESEIDNNETFLDESFSMSALDVSNLDDEKFSEDEEDDDVDPETVLNFITSRVKMQDPVTNKPIYPLVSILQLPESHFEFTSVVKVNDIQRGVLNLMFKQAAQLERMISGFKMDSLPLPTRKIVRMLQTAPELKSKEYLNMLDKQLASRPSLRKLAIQTQLMILNFLGEYISDENYMGELVDGRGRTRSVWRVFTKIGNEEAMITPFGPALHKATNEIHKPFREVVSFSFAPLSDVQSKMKKTVMHGDWSSTCSSSSKLSC